MTFKRQRIDFKFYGRSNITPLRVQNQLSRSQIKNNSLKANQNRCESRVLVILIIHISSIGVHWEWYDHVRVYSITRTRSNKVRAAYQVRWITLLYTDTCEVEVRINLHSVFKRTNRWRSARAESERNMQRCFPGGSARANRTRLHPKLN